MRVRLGLSVLLAVAAGAWPALRPGPRPVQVEAEGDDGPSAPHSPSVVR